MLHRPTIRVPSSTNIRITSWRAHPTFFFQMDVEPSRNLATYSTTMLESEAEELVREGVKKNFADKHEYAGVDKLHRHCLRMLASLYNSPAVKSVSVDPGEGVGTATVGSSEVQNRHSKEQCANPPARPHTLTIGRYCAFLLAHVRFLHVLASIGFLASGNSYEIEVV